MADQDPQRPPTHGPYTKRSKQFSIRVSQAWLTWWDAQLDAVEQETGVPRQKLNLLVLEKLESGVVAEVAQRAAEIAAENGQPVGTTGGEASLTRGS